MAAEAVARTSLTDGVASCPTTDSPDTKFGRAAAWNATKHLPRLNRGIIRAGWRRVGERLPARQFALEIARLSSLLASRCGCHSSGVMDNANLPLCAMCDKQVSLLLSRQIHATVKYTKYA